MKTEFEIEICYKCNWYCDYCCVKTHTKQPTKDNEIINNFLDYKIKNTTITLSGGEPSYANPELLNFFISYSKQNDCKLNLNTNGRFFIKYPELVKYFNTINYHCSENLEPEKIKVYPYNIKYLIILTDNNLTKLDTFIETNKEFFPTNKLTIIPANNPYGVDGPELSIINYKKVLDNYRKYMTPESALIFLSKNKKFNTVKYITNFKDRICHD